MNTQPYPAAVKTALGFTPVIVTPCGARTPVVHRLECEPFVHKADAVAFAARYLRELLSQQMPARITS